MIGRGPHEIWQDSLHDGQRRLARPAFVLAATGLLGGFHVTLGLMALVVVTGALAGVMPEPTAHVLGSLTFGIGFVFLTIGRSELFTENFLIPVAAVLSGHASWRSVGRLWAITLVLNLAGIALFVVMMSTPGVLEQASLKAAGALGWHRLRDRPDAIRDAIRSRRVSRSRGLAGGCSCDLTTSLSRRVPLRDVSNRLCECLRPAYAACSCS